MKKYRLLGGSITAKTREESYFKVLIPEGCEPKEEDILEQIKSQACALEFVKDPEYWEVDEATINFSDGRSLALEDQDDYNFVYEPDTNSIKKVEKEVHQWDVELLICTSFSSGDSGTWLTDTWQVEAPTAEDATERALALARSDLGDQVHIAFFSIQISHDDLF